MGKDKFYDINVKVWKPDQFFLIFLSHSLLKIKYIGRNEIDMKYFNSMFCELVKLFTSKVNVTPGH